MEWLTALWTDQNSVGHILLVYALVITVGTILGRIKVFGISLGVTFVLFAGLAAGYLGLTVNQTIIYSYIYLSHFCSPIPVPKIRICVQSLYFSPAALPPSSGLLLSES